MPDISCAQTAAAVDTLSPAIVALQEWLKNIVTIQTAVIAVLGFSLKEEHRISRWVLAIVATVGFVFSYIVSAALFQTLIWYIQHPSKEVKDNIYDITIYWHWLTFGLACTLQNIFFLIGMLAACLYAMLLRQPNPAKLLRAHSNGRGPTNDRSRRANAGR